MVNPKTEHLRRRLDTLLNAANAIDFEAGQAASAWNDYQQFSNRHQPNRQSGYVSSRVPSRVSCLDKIIFQNTNLS